MTDFVGAVAQRVLPSSAYGYYQQAQQALKSPAGQNAQVYTDSMLAQFLAKREGAKGDGWFGNSIQALAPKHVYNPLKATKGHRGLLVPYLLGFKNQVLAYRLAQEAGKVSNRSVSWPEFFGAMFFPTATKALLSVKLTAQGQVTPSDFNPLN